MADRPVRKAPQRPSPSAAARPSPNDPKGYRGPGFRDAPTYDYQIDYAGLPKDEEEDASLPPPSGPALPSAVLTSHEAHNRGGRSPRGMGGRRPDRGGTDPNAYRSPGFSEQRDARFRGHPMTRGDIGPAPGADAPAQAEGAEASDPKPPTD
jgi:hypothetical protein